MEELKLKEKSTKSYDCARGCDVERTPIGELKIRYNPRCCKLSSYNWMEGIHQNRYSDLFEVRFKNTRKIYFRNTSGLSLPSKVNFMQSPPPPKGPAPTPPKDSRG